MANTVVVGVQWGDEGKGKFVDWLAADFDVVVRFQGGNNAGHTLVVEGNTYKLSMLPSGAVRPGILSVIGGGAVLEPWAMLEEVDDLRSRGIAVDPGNLAIADNITLILNLHKELDALRENSAGGARIGTTGRGIGPAYEDKIGRRAVRLADLGDEASTNAAVERLLRHHNALRNGLNAPPVDAANLIHELRDIAPKVLPFARPAWKVIGESQGLGRRILYEGAQGALLDIDHGSYPYVTSSSTVPGNALSGSGSGMGTIGTAVGVAKSYTTRVGEGPFPTELHDGVGEYLAKSGHEFGTVTGRPRRCGWFDACLTKQMCGIAGIDLLALTKLDVLDNLDELKICVGYRINGDLCDHFPAASALQSQAEPVYETVRGWSGSTAGIRKQSDLPTETLEYVRRIEAAVGVQVGYLSTSPERNDIIELSAI